jgi:hypothetical protein
MKNLYTMQPPYEIRDELMTTDSFFIPNTQSGVKTAAFMESSSRSDRLRLFKLAAKDGDLDKAYKKLKAMSVEDSDDFEYDPADEENDSEPIGLAEDSSEVEDDEDDDDDDDDDDDEFSVQPDEDDEAE